MLKPNIKDGDDKIYPYHEVVSINAFHYLDSDEALPLFEKQADIIMERGYKGIIDVGCRVGRINDILASRGYEYDFMGFDTSPEPIDIANEKWKDYKNIEYRVASWNDPENIKVDFDVDVVLFSGVLCYVPEDHKKLFHSLVVNLYDADGAIIQDLRNDQTHTLNRIIVNYVYDELLEYKNFYRDLTEYKIDCDFYYGKRSVMDVRIYEP